MLNRNLSVVLPAYNEERNVERVISKITVFLPSITNDFEIIVIKVNVLEPILVSSSKTMINTGNRTYMHRKITMAYWE
jgi:hypothetical protein